MPLIVIVLPLIELGPVKIKLAVYGGVPPVRPFIVIVVLCPTSIVVFVIVLPLLLVIAVPVVVPDKGNGVDAAFTKLKLNITIKAITKNKPLLFSNI